MEPLTSVSGAAVVGVAKRTSGAAVVGVAGRVSGGEAVDARDRRRSTASGVDADDRSESSPLDDSADSDTSLADISTRLHTRFRRDDDKVSSTHGQDGDWRPNDNLLSPQRTQSSSLAGVRCVRCGLLACGCLLYTSDAADE